MRHMSIERSERMAGIWLHEDVELRLQEAMRIQRMLPMPRNGMPGRYRAHWPDIVHNAADRMGWRVGADSDENLKEGDADRNRVRLLPNNRQLASMHEALDWLYLIRDQRKRKVVAARSHRFESGNARHNFSKLAREMHTHRHTVRRWYREGIREICERLNGTRNF